MRVGARGEEAELPRLPPRGPGGTSLLIPPITTWARHPPPADLRGNLPAEPCWSRRRGEEAPPCRPPPLRTVDLRGDLSEDPSHHAPRGPEGGGFFTDPRGFCPRGEGFYPLLTPVDLRGEPPC